MKLFKFNAGYILFASYLIISWIYLLIFLQPVLQYQVQQPGFMTNISFFNDYTGFPGGITEYISVFLMQFFYFNWAGSLIIVLIALGISILTARLIRNIFPNNLFVFLTLFIPILIILVLNNNYLYPLAATLRILLVLIALTVFDGIPMYFKSKVPAFFVLYFLLYYISGGAAMIVFTLCSILLLIKYKVGVNTYIYGLIFILFAVIFPYLAYKYIFNVCLSDAYFHIFPNVPSMLIYKANVYLYVLYAYLPSLIIITYCIRGAANYFVRSKNNNQIITEVSDKPKEVGSFDGKTLIGNLLEGKFLWLKNRIFFTSLTFLLVSILSAFLLVRTINKENRYILLSDYYTERREWNKVIENALNYYDYSVHINWDFDRALFHTGKLADSLFKYRQILGSDGMFPDKIIAGETVIPSCELYFDLGFISESQHWAFEAQTLLPYSPRVLKILIVNYLILKKYTLAEKFLNILDGNFLYRNWVRQYRGLLNDTVLISENDLIAEKRKMMLMGGLISMNSKGNLISLLHHNSNNKMAFEYLESYYLLNHNLNEFYNVLINNEDYINSRIPRIYQEAILIYYLRSKVRPKTVLLHKIDNNVINEFSTFTKILKDYKGNFRDAKEILKESFSDTYWYYVIYDSPLVTGTKLKSIEVK